MKIKILSFAYSTEPNNKLNYTCGVLNKLGTKGAL